MLGNQQVAAAFYTIADLMELLGEDRFKLQAYRRAADTLADLHIGVTDYYSRGSLDDIPGVGKAIAAKIAQLFETGKIDLLERLKQQVPETVVDVMRVPGVGPKTAMRLYRELNIADTSALQQAAATGQISTLKGLGKKLEVGILAALAQQQERTERFLLGEALPLAEELLTACRSVDPSISAWSVAGSLRRAAPVVGDIDLLFAAPEPRTTLERLIQVPHVAAVEQIEQNSARLRLHNGCPCSMLVVPPERYGAALVLWTGNDVHRQALQTLADEHGLRLADDGLWQGETLVPSATEGEAYAALGLAYIPPELREGWGEIEAARAGKLPVLIEQHDLQADLHMHTMWSDGGGTVLERAEACLRRGYRYAVITDHSAYMGMVQGLDAARLREQRAEIDAANAELVRRGVDFKLLQGSEVDILPDGTLALPDDVLATLDWVVASLHVSLKQERAAVTERLLRAIRNPHVDCIGHPTGRLLLRRQGADLDMEQVLTAAAETGTVLEIDGAYPRLDLDAEWAHRALGMGIKLAIDSDAHYESELDNIRYGVLTARRSWATAGDVVNTRSWDELGAQSAERRA